MTEDLKATYETIDSLQMSGNYEEINQIAQYAIDAIANDNEEVTAKLRDERDA